MLLFLSLILLPFLCALVAWLCIDVISGVVSRSEQLTRFGVDFGSWMKKQRFWMGALFLATGVFGMDQMGRFYLFNGAYFWYVLLSFGLYLLLFIVPLGAVSLSFQTASTLKRQAGLNYCVIGFTLLWVVMLAMKTDPFVYLDEGGVAKKSVNLVWKNLALAGMIVNFILQASYLLSSKLANDRHVLMDQWGPRLHQFFKRLTLKPAMARYGAQPPRKQFTIGLWLMLVGLIIGMMIFNLLSQIGVALSLCLFLQINLIILAYLGRLLLKPTKRAWVTRLKRLVYWVLMIGYWLMVLMIGMIWMGSTALMAVIFLVIIGCQATLCYRAWKQFRRERRKTSEVADV
ncbi:hypothetical protein [Furfurilactobacillus entadae]|uniref:hypothetical protein n=1 Tax=Furfurilactobacillus entadae TaxID=2922307 RepID=UPI0038B27320